MVHSFGKYLVFRSSFDFTSFFSFFSVFLHGRRPRKLVRVSSCGRCRRPRKLVRVSSCGRCRRPRNLVRTSLRGRRQRPHELTRTSLRGRRQRPPTSSARAYEVGGSCVRGRRSDGPSGPEEPKTKYFAPQNCHYKSFERHCCNFFW
jgi:hypothetical protein